MSDRKPDVVPGHVTYAPDYKSDRTLGDVFRNPPTFGAQDPRDARIAELEARVAEQVDTINSLAVHEGAAQARVKELESDRRRALKAADTLTLETQTCAEAVTHLVAMVREARERAEKAEAELTETAELAAVNHSGAERAMAEMKKAATLFRMTAEKLAAEVARTDALVDVVCQAAPVSWTAGTCREAYEWEKTVEPLLAAKLAARAEHDAFVDAVQQTASAAERVEEHAGRCASTREAEVSAYRESPPLCATCPCEKCVARRGREAMKRRTPWLGFLLIVLGLAIIASSGWSTRYRFWRPDNVAPNVVTIARAPLSRGFILSGGACDTYGSPGYASVTVDLAGINGIEPQRGVVLTLACHIVQPYVTTKVYPSADGTVATLVY